MTAFESQRLLAGRTAVVTGGANGIGAAIVRRLSDAGAVAATFDLQRSRPAEETDRWTAIDVDVRDELAVEAASSATLARLGRIDVVVAAAGIVPVWRRVANLDLEEWDVFEVNARGVAVTVKHASGCIADGGAIVVVASLSVWRGDANLTSYFASKHAMLGIVRSAALNLGVRGIRFSAVGPGPIATDALFARLERRALEGGAAVADALNAAASGAALGRIATVAEVASAVFFLGSDLAAGITGHLLPVDGGIL